MTPQCCMFPALVVTKHVTVRGLPFSDCGYTQNNPLYLETFQQGSSDDALRFHYIVHCSLDAVEEKRAPPLASSGLLSPLLSRSTQPARDFWPVFGKNTSTCMHRLFLTFTAGKLLLSERCSPVAIATLSLSYLIAALLLPIAFAEWSQRGRPWPPQRLTSASPWPAAVALPRKAPGEPSDAYLGLLYPTEDYKVFGYGQTTGSLSRLLTLLLCAAPDAWVGTQQAFPARPPALSYNCVGLERGRFAGM